MKTAILSALESNPDALFWASFNCFEMRIPAAAVLAIAHPGQADADVAHWAPIVRAQMLRDAFPNAPTPDNIRAELKEYGAWDANDLADDDANWRRLVWIAACNISEEDAPDCSEPVSTN